MDWVEFRPEISVMQLPSKVTRATSYMDTNLCFTTDATLQQKSMTIQFCSPAMLI